MGNILCKETSKPRRQYVKSVNSPIDHVLTNNNTIERQNGQYESNVGGYSKVLNIFCLFVADFSKILR